MVGGRRSHDDAIQAPGLERRFRGCMRADNWRLGGELSAALGTRIDAGDAAAERGKVARMALADAAGADDQDVRCHVQNPGAILTDTGDHRLIGVGLERNFQESRPIAWHPGGEGVSDRIDIFRARAWQCRANRRQGPSSCRPW